MSFIDLITLFGIMIAMAAVPSTSVVVVVSRSIAYGLKHGAMASAGIATGDLLFVILALSGLSVLAPTLGEYFVAVKYLGGLYLIWFGISLLRSRKKHQAMTPGSRSLLGSYLAGLVLTLGDLKAVFFYASLFPAFVEVEQLSFTKAAVIAAITFVIVGVVKFGYAVMARKLSRRSSRMPGGTSISVAGGVSIGAGVFVLAKA